MRPRTYLVQLDGERFRVAATVWPADRSTGAGPEVDIDRVQGDPDTLGGDAAVDLDGWTDAQVDALCSAVIEAHEEMLRDEAGDRAEREARCGL